METGNPEVVLGESLNVAPRPAAIGYQLVFGLMPAPVCKGAVDDLNRIEFVCNQIEARFARNLERLICGGRPILNMSGIDDRVAGSTIEVEIEPPSKTVLVAR